MTGEELIAEGQRLAKPCVYLTDASSSGAPVAAVWGGNGFAAPSDGNYKHWFSFDASLLPASVGAVSGIVSVYTNEEDYETGKIVVSSSAGLPFHAADGVALYA